MLPAFRRRRFSFRLLSASLRWLGGCVVSAQSDGILPWSQYIAVRVSWTSLLSLSVGFPGEGGVADLIVICTKRLKGNSNYSTFAVGSARSSLPRTHCSGINPNLDKVSKFCPSCLNFPQSTALCPNDCGFCSFTTVLSHMFLCPPGNAEGWWFIPLIEVWSSLHYLVIPECSPGKAQLHRSVCHLPVSPLPQPGKGRCFECMDSIRM